MTSADETGGTIVVSLRSAGGKGIVHLENRFDSGIDAVWSALTDPDRLAFWLGVVTGDLRVGGRFQARFFASGWEGTGRVLACDPPHHFRVVTTEAEHSNEQVIEVTLEVDGSQTLFVLDQPGMPNEQLAAYAAGIQIHVEDLVACLAGRGRVDAESRWRELFAVYEARPVSVD